MQLQIAIPNLSHHLSSSVILTHNRSSKINRFPYFDRFFSQTSHMPSIATSEKMVSNQFPQPARPPNSYDMGFQEQSVDQSYVVPEPPSVVKEYELGEGKLAIVDKLVNRVLDKCNKHVESQTTTSRGLHQHPVEEKLERFKVRTVLAEEVVKEDNKN